MVYTICAHKHELMNVTLSFPECFLSSYFFFFALHLFECVCLSNIKSDKIYKKEKKKKWDAYRSPHFYFTRFFAKESIHLFSVSLVFAFNLSYQLFKIFHFCNDFHLFKLDWIYSIGFSFGDSNTRTHTPKKHQPWTISSWSRPVKLVFVDKQNHILKIRTCIEMNGSALNFSHAPHPNRSTSTMKHSNAFFRCQSHSFKVRV